MVAETPIYDLSVIVLSYNVKNLTRACIQSIINATHKIKYEIICVDDNSPDHSADMVRTEFPSVVLIANTENKRFSEANNIGLRASKGRYGLLLNCDTVVKSGAFDQLVAFMDSHPDIAGCGPKLLNPDGSTQYCVRRFPTTASLIAQTFNLHRLWPGNPFTEYYYCLTIDQEHPSQVECIGLTAFIMRREVWEEIGTLDTRFPQLMADQAYSRKMHQFGKRLYYVPEIEVIHYGSQSVNQNSRKAIIDLHNELKTFYSVFYEAKTNWLIRKLAYLGIDFRKWLKLLEYRLSADKRFITGPGAPQTAKK
jgi:GT2 family glycosyltransferase